MKRNKPMKAQLKLLFLLIILTYITPSCLRAKTFSNDYLTKVYNYKEIIKRKDPCGTPPLVEDELKYEIECKDPWILTKSAYILNVIREKLEQAVEDKSLWKAPLLTGTDYTVGTVGMGTFCFIDVYLDTDDFINQKLNCVYRIRYRWHSKNAFMKYLLGNRDKENMPHRCEYQFKSYGQAVENKEVKSDISWSVESRFEYRNESMPFKLDNSAPPPPWPFDEFIGYALDGKYKNFNPYPCHEYAKFLAKNLKEDREIKLKPVVVHVATRRRIHLNLDNEFGKISGDKGFGATSNYNQSILNTIDTVDIYSADILKLYRLAEAVTSSNGKTSEPMSKRLKRRVKNEIDSYWCGSFSEIEVEFERNVLSAINTELNTTENKDTIDFLEKAKVAFVSDVQVLGSKVREALASIGINTKETRTNKYTRDVMRLLEWRKKQK